MLADYFWPTAQIALATDFMRTSSPGENQSTYSRADSTYRRLVQNWQDLFDNSKDWQIACLLTLLAALLLLPTLGTYPFIDPSDAWYAEVAREMVETGNFLTPHLNYQPWFEKPILIYWLIAACYKTFAVSEFVAPLPSALSAVALVPLCYLFASKYICKRAALLAAITLASCPMLLIIGHMCLTDLPLTLFLSVSIGAFFYALTKKGQLAGSSYSLHSAVFSHSPERAAGAIFGRCQCWCLSIGYKPIAKGIFNIAYKTTSYFRHNIYCDSVRTLVCD